MKDPHTKIFGNPVVIRRWGGDEMRGRLEGNLLGFFSPSLFSAGLLSGGVKMVMTWGGVAPDTPGKGGMDTGVRAELHLL